MEDWKNNIKENMELQKIIDVIEQQTNEKLGVKNRKRHIVTLRFIYFKLARQYTNYSFERIGDALAKDHASVMHGIKMFEVVVKEKEYLLIYEKCKRLISELPVDETATVSDVIDYYEGVIYKLKTKKKEVNNQELQVDEKQVLYETIMNMDEKTFTMFNETRVQPFLKMHR